MGHNEQLNSQLYFGGNPDHRRDLVLLDPDCGIFQRIFYCCDCYRQLRIKYDNHYWKYVLYSVLSSSQFLH